MQMYIVFSKFPNAIKPTMTTRTILTFLPDIKSEPRDSILIVSAAIIPDEEPEDTLFWITPTLIFCPKLLLNCISC